MPAMTKASFAAIKRRIQPGARILCVENTRIPDYNGKVRVVTKAQGNCFKYHVEGEDPKPYYCTYETGTRAVDDETFRIPLGSDGHVLLRLLP
jgi:hypothetical protein